VLGIFLVVVSLGAIVSGLMQDGEDQSGALAQPTAQSESRSPSINDAENLAQSGASSSHDVRTSADNGFFPWASLLSAGAILIGAGIALLGLYSQRQLARASATLDLLNRNIWDEDFISARQHFNKLSRKNGGLKIWAEKSHWDSSQVDAISAMLNDYELMAIGVRNGVLDEELYRDFCRSIVLDHWEQARPFVEEIRGLRDNQHIFLEFEALAVQWGNKRCYEGKKAERVVLRERNNNL